MDEVTANRIRELDIAFYRENRISFSETREHPWPGWKRIADALDVSSGTCRILDVACGNLRFERFLASEMPQVAFDFTCIDSCDDFAADVSSERFVHLDVIEALDDGSFVEEGARPYDAAVSFGFMHHLPTCALRELFVLNLVESVRPDGIVALSFWRFMNDAKLARKAEKATRAGCDELGFFLGQGDYLLGWGGSSGTYRYCHHFSDEEIERLVGVVSNRATVVDAFNADGRNGELNGYVVFRKQ